MDTGSLPGVKYGRSLLLTPHPLLVPRSWKSSAIPLPTNGPLTGTLYLLYGGLHMSFRFNSLALELDI